LIGCFEIPEPFVEDAPTLYPLIILTNLYIKSDNSIDVYPRFTEPGMYTLRYRFSPIE